MMTRMKLDVLPSADPPSTNPWYTAGLRFACTQCGNCCTGGPGYVWISKEEVTRLADFLKLSPRQVLSRYCRKIGQRWSLKERRMPNGNYDCVFLEELPAPEASKGKQLAPGDRIPLKRRSCAIYPVRPLQCRTWPFWDTNLSDSKKWDFASRKCPGMNNGTRTFTKEQIESLRDARDWPSASLTCEQ